MKLLIISDAHEKKYNGVIHSYLNLLPYLKEEMECHLITTSNFKYFELPFRKDVDIVYDLEKVNKEIKNFNPSHIHLATEGPLGIIGRKYAKKHKIKISSAFHTNFHDYVPSYLSESMFKYLKWFHRRSEFVLVQSNVSKKELDAEQFHPKIEVWTKGVSLKDFYFTETFPKEYLKYNNKIKFLYVGRICKEKNIDQFLNIKTKAHKFLIGTGPYIDLYKNKYKNKKIHFLGFKTKEELAPYYSHADLFVFPSKTDTFANVVLESVSCKTPVVIYDNIGANDIIDKYKGIGCSFSNEKDYDEFILNYNPWKIKQTVIDEITKEYSISNSSKEFLKLIKS
jgi:glycosyltransferase involved in cell wall biosynthesis